MQGKVQGTIEFTLLSNGLDFIWSAVEHLSSGSGKRELKYAVLHLCSGIELVLKERLRREHWSLVFQKLDSASKKAYETGGFISASFHACLKRLTNICGVNITEKQRQELIAFRSKRNRMEHFNIVDSVDALTAAAAGVLSFLVDFINAELHPENFSDEDVNLLDSIRRRLSEFEVFVSKRWDAIREDLRCVDTAVVICPSCRQNAAILDDGAYCLFCGYQRSAEEAADSYVFSVLGVDYFSTIRDGGEWPLFLCPSCGRDTLVNRCVGGGQFPEVEFVCFGCGEGWMEGALKHCNYCGQPYVPGEDGSAICDECLEMRVQSDD